MLKQLEAGTSYSLGGAVREAKVTFALAPVETSAPRRQAVMLQGTFVRGTNGDRELMVAADPRVVERKLAIRAINARLEGHLSAGVTTKR